MKKVFSAMLIIAVSFVVVGCVAIPGRDPTAPINERLAADRAWYCGEGMLGVRAVARAGLKLLGLWVPNTCMVIDAVIDEAEEEEAALND